MRTTEPRKLGSSIDAPQKNADLSGLLQVDKALKSRLPAKLQTKIHSQSSIILPGITLQISAETAPKDKIAPSTPSSHRKRESSLQSQLAAIQRMHMS